MDVRLIDIANARLDSLAPMPALSGSFVGKEEYLARRLAGFASSSEQINEARFSSARRSKDGNELARLDSATATYENILPIALPSEVDRSLLCSIPSPSLSCRAPVGLGEPALRPSGSTDFIPDADPFHSNTATALICAWKVACTALSYEAPENAEECEEKEAAYGAKATNNTSWSDAAHVNLRAGEGRREPAPESSLPVVEARVVLPVTISSEFCERHSPNVHDESARPSLPNSLD